MPREIGRVRLSALPRYMKSAHGPRRAKGDVGEVQPHSFKDHTAGDRYLASLEARSKPHKSLQLAKACPLGELVR